QVLGNERRAVQRTRHTADDDELHPAARERGQGLLKIRNHVQRPDFATSGRNRPMKRVALTSCWARCSVVSRRFLSTNVKSMSRLKTSSTGSNASAVGPNTGPEGSGAS